MVAGKPPHRLLASSLLLRGARAPTQINTATPTPRTQHQPIYRREKCPKSEKWNAKNEKMKNVISTPDQNCHTNPEPIHRSNTMEGKTYRGEKGGKTRVKSNRMKYDSLHQINASTPTHAQRINQYTMHCLEGG